MNLGSLLLGVIGTIFGNSVVGKANYNVADDGYWESTDDATNLSGALDNFGKKFSGSGLTRAERQANAFTAQREDIAWQRQIDASNTAYQRQVADMQAAGINPMLAVSGGSGAAVPSASPGSSVAPGSANLGSLLQLFSLPAQIANLNADTKEKKANAESKQEQTRGDKMKNDWFEITRSLEYEGLELSNNLSKSRIEEVNQSIEESKSRVDKNIAETHESSERANLYVEQSILAKAQAQNITYMQPFLAKESEAHTEEMKSRAQVAIIDAAYRQRLIDSGTIEAAVRASNAQASESEVKAAVAKVEKVIKEKDAATTPDPESKNVCERIVAGIRAASRAIQGK